jgi:hypothetical protein
VASDLIKQHLHKGSLRMKQQADKSRSERKFEVGDSVFLKLQPYVQTSLAPRANQKLAYKYFGPIKVLHPVGQVAYRLELPPSSLHLVFHVSQLKKVVSEGTVVSTSLPGDLPDLQFPEAVLKRRVVSKGLRSVVQVLVKWSVFSSRVGNLGRFAAVEAAVSSCASLRISCLLWGRECYYCY